MMEGSGSGAGSGAGSVLVTNGSGRPKNTRIRIRNTAENCGKFYHILESAVFLLNYNFYLYLCVYVRVRICIEQNYLVPFVWLRFSARLNKIWHRDVSAGVTNSYV
jgi:hypothetical protein